MRAWLRLLRPGDWTKNAFVLVPAVFWLSGQGRGLPAEEAWAKVLPIGWAFLAFCLAASGSYCVNDALDAEKDRRHPVKRRRPVASGAIPVSSAVFGGFALEAAGEDGEVLGVEAFQAAGGSMVMLAKGNRSKAVVDACKKHRGFYLGSIGGPAAILAKNCIKKVEVLEYPELGMEAIWRIQVENFPAFIVTDDKGNDFFSELKI